MGNYAIPENPKFDLKVRRLEPTDRAHADVFNAIFQQLLNNEAYLFKDLESITKNINKISFADIDALGGLSPIEGGSIGGLCGCEAISNEEIQKIIDTIVSNGSSTGSLETGNQSISEEEIQKIINET